MKYAKLNNGELHYAPNKVRIGDYIVINPSEEQLQELGYKKLVYTNPEQKDGYYFTCTWNENETEIYPVWEEHLLPEPELTDGEYLLEKLGL